MLKTEKINEFIKGAFSTTSYKDMTRDQALDLALAALSDHVANIEFESNLDAMAGDEADEAAVNLNHMYKILNFAWSKIVNEKGVRQLDLSLLAWARIDWENQSVDEFEVELVSGKQLRDDHLARAIGSDEYLMRDVQIFVDKQNRKWSRLTIPIAMGHKVVQANKNMKVVIED